MGKRKINIAIIDNHPIVIEDIKKIVEQGFTNVNTNCFTLGELFLNSIQKKIIIFDIVLLDITLPDINGILLCKKKAT